MTAPPPLESLRDRLRDLDGSPYGAYKSVKGSYDAGDFTLVLDYVQGDPFARPSRMRAQLTPAQAGLPDDLRATEDRRRACADFLNRALAASLRRRSGRTGSGRSGELTILLPGQQVLERTSLRVSPDGAVEARFRAGLPARGRRILGKQAATLLLKDAPAAIREALPWAAVDEGGLRAHVESVEDAVALRAALDPAGLVAFVADGALLPRRTGADDRPLDRDHARAFRSPASLRVTLQAPHAGPVTGMGVPRGVTLIAGGGYHGKSTLLTALQNGIYDHVPGDGRERVVCAADAVKIRAEDGRRVAGTDISGFIADLPGGASTERFESENASGSTSQAAAIAEALEVGTTCLLLDEDTSATNFMIRDARMQALVPDEAEPITPFIDRVQALAGSGVSTILVVGGSGDYFDVADVVIVMREYLPTDATTEAREIASERPSERTGAPRPWRSPRPRRPRPEGVDPRERGRVRIKVPAIDRVRFGGTDVDLGAVEQLVERAQTVAVATAAHRAVSEGLLDGERTLAQVAAAVGERLGADSVDAIDPEPVGDYAAFRPHELAAFLNRLRTLETR